MVFVHGGGWWQGWIDSSVIDTTCRERCVGAGVVVVSVGYRKAPEHAFPTPLDDVLAALQWTHNNATALGIDAGRIGIGGQSAGANLAAAAALRNRDEDGPHVAMQLLEVPVLDLTLELASANGTDEELDGLRECVDFYLDDPEHAHLPYASPLRANDLTRLPPTHVMVAGLDPLRDDGSAYAARLADAQLDVTLTAYPQHLHATPTFTALAEGRRWRDEVVDVTRRLLAAPS
jgi:acetyl esterase